LEKAGGRKVLNLRSVEDNTSPGWLKMTPDLTLKPGEHVLLRFEFLPGKKYDGYLMLISNLRDYREYALPESGMPLAFGTAPDHTKVLSLWNTHEVDATYRFSMQCAPGNSFLPAEQDFGTVVVSHYNPELLPVRVESFIPLRVAVIMDQPGYLETVRSFLRGYRATVDGHPATVTISPQSNAMIPLSAGKHEVELRYVGTLPLKITAAVSGAAWLCLLVIWLRRRSVVLVAEPQSNF
jgi:hypothetical protein